MEFEPNEAVSDEARLLAQTKKVTLQPADPFLKPNDIPDPIAMSETHRNIEPDSEDTTRVSGLIQPSGGALKKPIRKFHHTPTFKLLAICVSLVVGLGAGVGYFFFFG